MTIEQVAAAPAGITGASYLEKVYAGVLGKIIGVYLGRPFEGWTYDHIMKELGEVNYYVHDRLGVPLIVTDDDISGTFTFLRSLPDHNYSRDLTAEQIGRTWLNYLIDRRTILWWGGRGNSTEHTAYLNLKNGIPAPRSGSIAQNSQVVAEQIGAQIFIDGWAMVAPGDPALAANLAYRAGSVSHDGEALYGAQVVAAIEAQAFVESDLNKLLDTAVTFIPKDSIIYRLIGDIRNWHAGEKDWRKTREKIAGLYGYDKYGGNCHMIPNHALIIHALLHGEDDFQKSLMIVNTCGWDTDCNSGNVGCILGIKNGLASIDAGPDWRGPVADRMYLPTADGGRAITDAVQETYHVVNTARRLNGMDELKPKKGARFHFELPDSVQGFMPEESIDVSGTTRVSNVVGHSRDGERSLAIQYQGVTTGRTSRVSTPTFIPSDEVATYFEGRGYRLICSPTLYGGQKVEARVQADSGNQRPVRVNLYVYQYGKDDVQTIVRGTPVELKPGADQVLSWQIPDTGGAPLGGIGLEISSETRADGTVYLDYLTWTGAPTIQLKRPEERGKMWLRAWVNGLDHEELRDGLGWYTESYRLIQNEGRGLISQGEAGWTDYRVSATMTPHMAQAAGIGARVQGLNRYYALLLRRDNKAQLVKVMEDETILAESNFAWEFGKPYELALSVQGNRLTGSINGQKLFDVTDTSHPLAGGGVALIIEEGRTAVEMVTVAPV